MHKYQPGSPVEAGIYLTCNVLVKYPPGMKTKKNAKFYNVSYVKKCVYLLCSMDLKEVMHQQWLYKPGMCHGE